MTSTPSNPVSHATSLAARVVLVASSAFGLVVGLAACSEDNAAPTPTVELAPTSTPITTEPPTTTTAPTTEAPTTTEDPRIAEIEAAVVAARELQVQVLTDPSIPVERMQEVVTGRALESVTTNLLKMRAEGQTGVGSFESRRLSTTIVDNAHATHLECGLDALASFTIDGDPVVPADETPFLRRYDLELIGDRWLVEFISFEGSERTSCEL